jgi:serine/threonine-protein kinase HipA
MTSEISADANSAFVWVWLPGQDEPVVAGRIDRINEVYLFTYGASYRSRDDAVPLYLPELPVEPGQLRPRGDLTIAGCLGDGAPDAWGRRVVLTRRLGRVAFASDVDQLDLLAYMLESGSDRFGAIDFQTRSDVYVSREGSATLAELQQAAELVESGATLTPALDAALLRGTSIGGARPKALITDDGRHVIAKFSSVTDTYPVVRAEAVAMNLAQRVGLNVAPTQLLSSLGKDVLLVERFDRERGTRERKMAVSALTILELHEMTARYASYADLADIIRARFTDPRATLRELFSRIVFNIAVGNIDDHARNHAALWDGEMLTLSPAYDLCPQPRSGETAAQAMAIDHEGRRESQFIRCVTSAGIYQLSEREARDIIDHQVATIEREWDDAAGESSLTAREKDFLWHRQILNPYASYGY